MRQAGSGRRWGRQSARWWERRWTGGGGQTGGVAIWHLKGLKRISMIHLACNLSIFIHRYEHFTWECESAILKSFEDRSIACGSNELQPLYFMFVVAVYLFQSLFHSLSLLIASSLFVWLPLHLSCMHTHRWHNHPTMIHCFAVYLELFNSRMLLHSAGYSHVLANQLFSPQFGRKHTTPSCGSTHTRTRNKYRLDHRNDNMTLFLNTRSEAIALNEHNLSNTFTHTHAHMHNDIQPTATANEIRGKAFFSNSSQHKGLLAFEHLRQSKAFSRWWCDRVCVCVYEVVRGMSLYNSKNPLNFKAERIIYTQYWLWVNIY